MDYQLPGLCGSSVYEKDVFFQQGIPASPVGSKLIHRAGCEELEDHGRFDLFGLK